MRIQHNIAAMNSYRNYSNNVAAVSKNLEKLSSGYKINRAGDDAAGLAISEKMRAQITGLEAAQKNVKDGISLVKTAEGAMQEIQDMLNRMDYLATQSANGTYDNEVDRLNLQKEVTALKDEINRIADSANFNGIKLLDGSLASDVTSSSSSSQVDLSKLGVDVLANKVTNVTAAKGKFAGQDLSNFAASCANLENGDKITVKMNYTDAEGVTRDKEITLRIGKQDNPNGTTDNMGIYLEDGSKDGIFVGNMGGTAGTLDANSFSTALKAALEKDADFKAAFEMTVADSAAAPGTKSLTFESRVAGADGAKLNSWSMTFLDKGDKGLDPKETTIQVGLVTKTKAEDSLQAINLQNDGTTAGIKVLDLSATTDQMANNKGITNDIKDAIFEINGQKFAFIKGGKENDVDYQKALREAGVTHWVALAADASVSVVAADIEKMVNKISTATGLKVDQGSTTVNATTGEITWNSDTGATKAATSTKIVIRPSGPVESKTGGTGGLTLQIGDTADKFNQLRVAVGDMHVNAMGTGKTTLDGKEVNVTKTIADIDISSLTGAQEAIGVVRNAINYVSGVRGDLGAVQNRLEHTQNNLSVMKENIQDAESTIRDTDVAEEMMSYTKNNILVQSAQAMLAQANQIPQGVLQLLG